MYKIAVSGKAKSGKDTLSEFLRDEIEDYYWRTLGISRFSEKIAFADPIKEIILKMYPNLNPEFLYGSSEHRNQIIPGSFKDGKPLTIRQCLQDIGEGFKIYNPKIWINIVDGKINNLSNEYCLVVVSDLRFIDELTYLKSQGFIFIRIKRNEAEDLNHISEKQQDQILDQEFDFIINNDGTLNDLNDQVIRMVRCIVQ